MTKPFPSQLEQLMCLSLDPFPDPQEFNNIIIKIQTKNLSFMRYVIFNKIACWVGQFLYIIIRWRSDDYKYRRSVYPLPR